MALKMKPDQARRVAEQALEMYEQDKDLLLERLPAGLMAGMQEDAGLLSNKTASSKTARLTSKTNTAVQNDLAKKLAKWVSTTRRSVRRTCQDKAVRTAVGMGERVHPKVVKTVLAGADAVLKAYTKYPDALRAAGLLPRDVEAINTLASALRAADTAQEKGLAKSRQSTAARKKVQARVESALETLIAAAELEFAVENPERAAEYAALIPTKRARRKPKPTE